MDQNKSNLSTTTLQSPVVPAPAAKKKIFFPNLDALRFFSFFVVFLSHGLATDKEYIRNESWYKIFKGRLFSDGDLGVSFFFVLSGFLITYLLLVEKELNKKIHVGSFYIRRALRIWPLYFFCVIFGFIIFPYLKTVLGQVPNETADPLLCSLFLNNFNTIINGPPDSSVLSVLWSVAIEEQFYLVWPLLFVIVPARYYQYIFIAIIAMSVTFRFIHPQDADIHSLGVISDMAIGGLAAYLSIKHKRFLSAMENSHPMLNLLPYLAALIFIGFKYQLFADPFFFATKRLFIAFFFVWIILEQNFCKRSYFKLSNLKLISRLGKYTYGLYCLHTIAGLITVVVLAKLGLDNYTWQLWLLSLPMSLLLSIAFSYISYRFFESRFLKLKDRFAYIVKS